MSVCVCARAEKQTKAMQVAVCIFPALRSSCEIPEKAEGFRLELPRSYDAFPASHTSPLDLAARGWHGMASLQIPWEWVSGSWARPGGFGLCLGCGWGEGGLT